MALIREIERSDKVRKSLHRPARCMGTIVSSVGDALGSPDREFADKVSQSIQFDRTSAEQLIALFREAFPGIA